MDSFIHVFGKDLPVYGLCWIVGVVLAGLVAMLLCRRHKIDIFDLTCAAVFAMIGALIGAKLLFVIVSLPTIIELKLSPLEVIQGGFVFYGGLLGGILGMFIYTKMYKLSFIHYTDLFAVVVPLGHACGRVGCLFGGCCYGQPYDGPLAWTYHDTIGNAPQGVPLFPIQGLEAALLMVLFVVLLVVHWRRPPLGTTTAVYLCAYAVMRFVLEYFRGDAARGGIGILSTSQIISILMVVSVIVVSVIRNKTKHTTE